MKDRPLDPVVFAVVAVFDNNNDGHKPPRTHLVHPIAVKNGSPYFSVCGRCVVGRLLEDPSIAQVPCPRCARLAVVR